VQIVLIADAFPPMKTSGAVQIRDLAGELDMQGHKVTILLPDSTISHHWQLDEQGNIAVLRLKAPVTKDVSYFKRAIGEYLLSFFMFENLKKSPLKDMSWDALVWYSPTIFFGSLVKKIKAESGCNSYLILRDIFPEWAVDMGLLSRSFIYRYFKRVESFQYMQADTIGVQTASNLDYFQSKQKKFSGEMQVLNNWLSDAKPGHCRIQINDTPLSGRKIFIYTGNIGIAQGMDILIDLANELRTDNNAGFIFVGRGTAVEKIKQKAKDYGLQNTLFFDEINPDEIPGLLAQCHVGLVALDPRHRNDNIPGKFLAYMQAGLPVLANINAGNDLERIINENGVGKVVNDNSLEKLTQFAKELMTDENSDSAVSERCKALSASAFSSEAAVKQIVKALSK
jgi:glycosyltransferase involved in cell wall biosynthesis